MKKILGVMAFLLVFPAPGYGQATQGTTADVERVSPTEFHSPMVLETVFPTPAELAGKGWIAIPAYFNLGRFTCDGVSLRGEKDDGFFWDRPKTETWRSGLTMKVRAIPDNKAEVQMVLSVHNPHHNHDKLVTLHVEIANGDVVVASEAVTIKAKDDGDDHNEKTKTVIPAGAITPTTQIRITMTTQNY